MFNVRFCRGRRDGEICGRDESEQHDETEEGQGKEDIHTYGADEEDEAGEAPVRGSGDVCAGGKRVRLHRHVVESLRTVVGSAICSTELTEGGCSLVYGVLLICKTGPVSSVDEKHCHREG